MGLHLRRSRRAALPVTLLVATTLAAPAPPAAAVTDEFGISTPMSLGDSHWVSTSVVDLRVPNAGDVGPFAPYPAQINLPQHATVLDVNVILLGVTGTAPSDLNVLLVGPGGQQAMVMSDVGGVEDISNLTLALDDEALATMGDAKLVTNTYRPLNQGGDGETFPAPAPFVTGSSELSVFDGTDAAGLWSLFVVDDQSSDVHSMSGWQLVLNLGTRPYPGTAQVGGLPPISDLDVKLQGLDTDRPDDAHFLLVGPQGQQAYLMGDSGGTTEIDDVHLVFDDEATAVLPDSGGILDGRYRPTRHDDAKFFPAPAPATSGNTLLSVFDGIDPDGTWQLFGMDDTTSGDFVTLDGWSLVFTWDDVASPTGTVVVNNGAAATAARDVTVELTASDPEGTGVAAVRLSNDGVTFAPYQPFAASLPWTLTEGNGEKKVYAQFKDGAGNESAIVSDTITLGQATPPGPATDTTGPRAAQLTPGKNAVGVKTTLKVKVKATEALKKGSVSKQTVFLKEKGVAGKVPAKVSYRAATRTLVITPNGPLGRHTTYVVTVRRVKDVAGNAWDQKPKKTGAQRLRYSFTTG